VLRRLTVPELDATVRAAFGLDRTQWAGPTVPPDPSSLDGFSNNVDRLTVGPEYARGALDSAREAAKVVSSQPFLAQLLPCSTAPGDGLTLLPCAQTFLSTFGTRLYRRPLTAAEKARYTDLFMKVGRGDFKLFVHWATFAMLQSPNVLYRSELGLPDGAGHYKLTPDELASALAFTFTGGPPSAELLQLAAGGRLATADQIEAAARSLVYDAGQKVKPAFQEMMLRFTDDYLGLSSLSNLTKDSAAFPGFNQEIQGALAEETRRFISRVLFEEKGTAASLLTAPYTLVNGKLAAYYGLPADPAAGADFVKVDRPPGWGVGVLSQGSFLAVESHNLSTSPTKRGNFVRTRVLCGTVPPPPPVVRDLPAPTGAETTRKRYEDVHLQDASCKSCHRMFDPIGFAFEHLDAAGRYREREGTFDIDDSGVVTGTSAGDLTFRGPTELAGALAKLPEVPDCVATYMAAFAFGLSQPNVSCLIRSASNELRAGMSLVDFYIRMARSEHFRTRLP
jgi:predicted ester cyclase